MQKINIRTTIESISNLIKGGDFNTFPIVGEVLSDMLTPIQAMARLKKASHHCFLLESADNTKKRGRYTFLGYDPIMEITCTNGTVRVKSSDTKVYENANPKDYISEILKEHKSPKFDGLPVFTGGLAGYFSYDYIKYSEPGLRLDAKDTENFKDVDLMLFDKVIVFDSELQKIFIIKNIHTENLQEDFTCALKELDKMAELILEGEFFDNKPLCFKSEIKSLFSREEYCSMAEKAKEYIREGDIFQAVLSNRLEAEADGSLFDTYRILRVQNPSPYMFYFSSDDVEIAGASPETLIKLENNILHTYPLAGTRTRGKDADEDKRLANELLNDEKELAEHNMLVDLGRNDIGKISSFGTVTVEKYLEVQYFSKVMHLGSSIRGEISEGKTALDAIDAVLPAGTLSGAPKLRACEIINELEDNKRGIYGGAIGYIDFSGNLDVCIAIRLAIKKNGRIFIRSGAGIVADSVPEKEYEECINKASAVVEAAKMSLGGIDK